MYSRLVKITQLSYLPYLLGRAEHCQLWHVSVNSAVSVDLFVPSVSSDISFREMGAKQILLFCEIKSYVC